MQLRTRKDKGRGGLAKMRFVVAVRRGLPTVSRRLALLRLAVAYALADQR